MDFRQQLLVLLQVRLEELSNLLEQVIACVAAILDAMVAVGVNCHLELFVEICIYILVLYIELYISAKTTSIRPLIIIYAGMLKSKNAKIPFMAISMKNVVDESAFSITELR